MTHPLKSQKFWDKAASTYDQEERKDEGTYLKIIEKTKKYLKASDVLLDFGCGTGLICNEIADQVKMIRAIDISPKMIAIARQKADGRKIENIDYAQATIFDKQYLAGSFDVILACYILHLLEDMSLVMHRMHELLKPGGLVVSATPCLGERRTLLNVPLSMASRIGLIPRLRAYTVSELEASIAAGNFEILETERLKKNSPEYFIVARKNQAGVL